VLRHETCVNSGGGSARTGDRHPGVDVVPDWERVETGLNREGHDMLASERTGFLPVARRGKDHRPERHQPGMTSNRSRSRSARCAGGPPVNVVEWRRCRLIESGFDPALADQLASTAGIDVHALLALVDRGCPPELAARILSPLGTP
jgi:hypothetical protein